MGMFPFPFPSPSAKLFSPSPSSPPSFLSFPSASIRHHTVITHDHFPLLCVLPSFSSSPHLNSLSFFQFSELVPSNHHGYQRDVKTISFLPGKFSLKLAAAAGACNPHLMRASNLSCNWAINRPYSCCLLTPPACFRHQHPNLPIQAIHANKWRRFHHLKCVAVMHRGSMASLSSWDDEPYEVLPYGKIAYLDEQDVVTFLDPPKELIPLDPSTYNPATYLWKKIESIPEKRRNRLLSLLKPRLISRAWEIAGMRYDDPKLATKSASSLLSDGHDAMSLEFWNCRTSGVLWNRSAANFLDKLLRKALFYSEEKKMYGRLIGGSLLAGISNSFFPLYFTVRQLHEVMSTEQPCDLAYEFGDGLFDLANYPQGFPNAVRHPWPFNDQVVIYIRHVGPGVLVGQAWQEGEALEQLPKKLCGEILMVKDYSV